MKISSGLKKLFYQKGFTPHHFFLKSGAGFTLTEMVVVLTIFVLIVVIVYSVYSLSYQGYRTEEDLAEITQNGRVILERMAREIRQAKEIVTELPEERINPGHEIKFKDGHLHLVSEEDTAESGTINTITLALSASDENNYYKDMFIKITSGTGVGQIRKIVDYDKLTKIATIESNWDTIPDTTSTYKIDSSFFYIHYYSADNNVLRRVFTYCFSEDSLSCVQPEIYVAWNATPPTGQTLLEVVLEPERTIGEYVTNLEFWGFRVVNIFLTLDKKNQSINLETKIFGRNL